MRSKSKSFIQIDKFALDSEWQDQPGLYLKFADALAEADADTDEAKAEMELVKAEVISDIREHPIRYGIKRISEHAVNAAVLLSPEFQAAQSNYHDCKRKTGLLKAAVRALEHRREALANIVYLHGQGYFADKPKSRLARMASRDAEDRVRKRMARAPLRESDDDDV